MQLGDLEKLVLQFLWSEKEADAKRVHIAVGMSRGNSLNTIQTTLDRLFKKSLLSRTKQGHAHLYTAIVDRESLIATLITDVTADFIEDGEHSLIAAFASSSANLDDAQFEALEKLIEQQRQLRSRQI
ncbi:BlaI/MecI/CopY family transcriptional regulator [Shewanella frigidimarina]|jgi:predicted transcriptional regulator|uniref:Transcriptional repressor, CopY family protein n=2 Tax=Shewanella TaxID=22 RepID=Q080E9_SHEFN|nr:MULTISPECIES: BlaI/MecI/CopY family transcriptional regulator [Shewanella]ABI72366.1 transcriptional repressor, CopY family protein [Shewanella frigidimarina NCIMB 400]AZG72807.1 BlaI/MecI/CopY family transcriptional regulator [Shewanella livingstonensis]MBB1427049.1 BlaI/MecI/CopY family transcriptional regulator [Shewanella sp. SG44-2]PKH98109.1 TrmB family transcriptional regulator [Shewanella sp. 11B5]RPA35527.1 BlaI/MecI/CopY family transcriptional regulator [Shewanella frigidimarina]|tara:strand:- start:3842 stop:4225 length:384 start_codon:yes stop_codon:yes gene_type:complete